MSQRAGCWCTPLAGTKRNGDGVLGLESFPLGDVRPARHEFQLAVWPMGGFFCLPRAVSDQPLTH